ncbi:MAG: hypothetical protein U0798_13430 [Gemmataceae bacterium]
MANPVPVIPPPEPPKSISAAELRRRLLASTPPPLGVSASSPEIDLEQEIPSAEDSKILTAPTPTPVNWAPGIGVEALAKLRMPGQAAPSSVPQPVVDAADPAAAQSRFPANRRGPNPGYGGYGGPVRTAPAAGSMDSQRLFQENAELRQLLAEMKNLLQDASKSEQQHAQKEQEYEALLAAKTHQVDELTSQIQHIEEQISSGALTPQQPQKSRSELEEWADELERENQRLTQERKLLDEGRKQLREDEEASEKQMRNMEVAMAKERAMMARQETELRRLHAEIQHELEIMNRGDANLREQMQKFQRRANDAMGRPAGPAGPPSSGSGVQGWGRR